MRRRHDWFRQAELDLAAARDARRLAHHEWACFATQQAAVKAAKALHESVGTEARGPSVAELLRGFDDVSDDILDAARALDKHYIPARYPNSHPTGAPGDLYTASEADRALADAQAVIESVRRRFSSA